ncbi:transposase [Singulisphaera sp. PoT]|uniref:transposase n=1 Tax=Singulisphaera sp. PoT TaxID=3411797 RepID=UPI003BF578A2
MATAHMPDEFFGAVAHHLPPEQPVGPKGGRPRVGHRTVLQVMWFVLTAGTRWEDVPEELGCSGSTAHRRLRAWEEAGIWDRLHADLLRLLREAGDLELDTVIVDGVTVRVFGGGEATSPSPVDRGRKGTKHTLMVYPSGVPLAIRTARANASDRHRSSRWCSSSRRSAAIWDVTSRCRTSCTLTEATTARMRGRCCLGWGLSRTSPSGVCYTAAGLIKCAGW